MTEILQENETTESLALMEQIVNVDIRNDWLIMKLANQAARIGTDSREWNALMSRIPPTMARNIRTALKSSTVYTHHAAYWPKPSTYPRFKMEGGRPSAGIA